MHHPERLSKLFAFAANIDPSGVSDIQHSPVFNAFIARAGKEYEKLSPTPKEYLKFVAAISNMWNTQPHWTRADFAKIRVPTWIVDGDHDEAINHDQPRTMADWTPGAGLLIEPDVQPLRIPAGPRAIQRRYPAFPAKALGMRHPEVRSPRCFEARKCSRLSMTRLCLEGPWLIFARPHI